MAARVSSVYTGQHGITVAMRNGAARPTSATPNGSHAKWLALERVLLDEGSAGAGYIDVRLPERPAAGGFAEGVPPPLSSATGEASASTGAVTEASVAALAEGLRANSPGAGAGAPVGANEPTGGSPSTSTAGEPQASGGQEEAAAPASTGAAASGGSGESSASGEASETSAAVGAAAAPGG